MKISARNQFEGTVSAVSEGAVNGIVTIDVGGLPIKSDITMNAIEDLGLEAGKKAIAVIKASNVLVADANEPLKNLSARNQFVGAIATITKGAVNGLVSIKLENNCTITAMITNEAIDSLGLVEGNSAVAIVKATDVLVALP